MRISRYDIIYPLTDSLYTYAVFDRCKEWDNGNREVLVLNPAAYEILALAARYWFVFLIGYILFRIIENSYTEYQYERSLKQGQEAVKKRYLGVLKIISVADKRDEMLGQKFFLTRENVIGRSQKSDLVISHPTVSNTHAEIYQKRGNLYIQDLQSKNGTFLNNKRIKKRQVLQSGDILQLGGVRLSVTLNEQNVR